MAVSAPGLRFGIHRIRWLLLCFLLGITFCAAYGQQSDFPKYLAVEIGAGEGIISLLRKYKLDDDPCHHITFLNLNRLTERDKLLLDRIYVLPVLVYPYNGRSIRSTIGMDNWDRAVQIQQYNEQMHRLGLKKEDYRHGDRELWVPLHFLNCGEDAPETAVVSPPSSGETRNPDRIFPIFGSRYEYVPVTDRRLSGYVFYLISGHGGPDPGAIGHHGGHALCEDEYAYDVTLRLGRKLLEHSATVYIIIRDPDDGIRDQRYLPCDRDEVSWPDQPIPVNQLARLQQRTRAVNNLYDQHRRQGNRTRQYVLDIHIDSREKNTAIDMFFYHHPSSRRGRNFARAMQRTVDDMYNTHRPGRGYRGGVYGRDLYILRETRPPAVLIELGNITNPNDQQRILLPSNRQAIANWLAEGIIRYVE